MVRDDEFQIRRSLAYPGFDEFLSMAEHERMELIDTYFALDIHRLNIPEDALDAGVQWTITRLDALRLEAKTISITGRVAKRK